MAFNIADFKSTIEKHGGPGKNNLFEVSLSSPKALWSDERFGNTDVKFFCKTATLPGISLSVFDYRPTNIEMPQSIPFAINHEQLECVFIVDDNHDVYRYFHRWMQEIVNYNHDGHSPESINPNSRSGAYQYPYELGYKKDYAQTMTVRKYSKYQPTPAALNSYVCTLQGVYPTSIGSTTMSWEDDSYTTLSVSFSYSSIIMSGVQANVTV